MAYTTDQASQGISVRAGQTLRIQIRVPVHVIAAKIKTRGGTPLVRHHVQAIDPDTNQPVGEPVMTDDQGRVQIEVPDGRGYHLRIVDDDPGDEIPHPSVGHPPTEDHVALAVRFLSNTGATVHGVAWTATGPGGSFSGTTDENGCLELEHIVDGVYEIQIRGHGYKVHTVRESDFPGGSITPSKLLMRG